LSHLTCSSLFMQVGVSVGVNGVSFDVDLYLYPPPLHSVDYHAYQRVNQAFNPMLLVVVTLSICNPNRMEGL
jgi:hypothetical protein